MRHIVIGVIVVLAAVRVGNGAQAPPVDATDVLRTDFDAVMKQFPMGGDQQIRIASRLGRLRGSK